MKLTITNNYGNSITLDQWAGPLGCNPSTLSVIQGVRLQGAHICIELIDDDGYECEYAVSLVELVKNYTESLVNYHQKDAADSKKETIEQMQAAILAIALG